MTRLRRIPITWTAPGKPAAPAPSWCPLDDYAPAGVTEMQRPDWLDPEQLNRLASELEGLNLKLHATEHNDYRPAILCGAALMRAIANGVDSVDGSRKE